MEVKGQYVYISKMEQIWLIDHTNHNLDLAFHTRIVTTPTFTASPHPPTHTHTHKEKEKKKGQNFLVPQVKPHLPTHSQLHNLTNISFPLDQLSLFFRTQTRTHIALPLSLPFLSVSF